MPVKVASETLHRLRDIRQALAVSWWHFADIYLRGNAPSAKIAYSKVRYEREGHIQVYIETQPSERMGPSGVYLPGEIKDILQNVRREFHHSFAGTGLIGQDVRINSEPSIAELDWSLRLLRPFWPASWPRKKYHVRFRVPAVFETRVSSELIRDNETGKILETENQLLLRLKERATCISDQPHIFSRNMEKSQAILEDVTVLEVIIEDYQPKID